MEKGEIMESYTNYLGNMKQKYRNKTDPSLYGVLGNYTTDNSSYMLVTDSVIPHSSGLSPFITSIDNKGNINYQLRENESENKVAKEEPVIVNKKPSRNAKKLLDLINLYSVEEFTNCIKNNIINVEEINDIFSREEKIYFTFNSLNEEELSTINSDDSLLIEEEAKNNLLSIGFDFENKSFYTILSLKDFKYLYLDAIQEIKYIVANRKCSIIDIDRFTKKLNNFKRDNIIQNENITTHINDCVNIINNIYNTIIKSYRYENTLLI